MRIPKTIMTNPLADASENTVMSLNAVNIPISPVSHQSQFLVVVGTASRAGRLSRSNHWYVSAQRRACLRRLGFICGGTGFTRWIHAICHGSDVGDQGERRSSSAQP